MDELEHKYQKIKYCGLRIENKVPDEYIEQAFAWLTDQRISGIAMGKIVISETKYRESNILYLAGKLKRTEDLMNAILLLQYAREIYPKQEKFLLEEADC